jgi:hypothetical protein
VFTAIADSAQIFALRRPLSKVIVTKPVKQHKIKGNLRKRAAIMSLNISPQTEARITEEAQRQGISVDALLERLINERAASTAVRGHQAPELPILHLGPMGPLHRRDIYDEFR